MMKRIFVALAVATALVSVAVPPLSAAVSPAISLEPATGPVGGSFTVKGSGFPSRAHGTVTFGGVQLGSFRASGNGSFSLSLSVPVATGTVAVTATAGSVKATQFFTVTSPVAPPPVLEPQPSPASGFVGRQGDQLTLGGVPYRPSGLNAYHLATDHNINYGCGEANSQANIDEFFASLAPNSMTRFWAFQHQAFNKNTGAIDFTTIDRVIQSAERAGQKLIVTIGNQGRDCDMPAQKDENWYAGGYRNVYNTGTYNGSGTLNKSAPLSYWDWMNRIVPRYANSPAVAIWEPINEPYPSTVRSDGSQYCSSTAPATLRTFFDTVGQQIHSLAPNHLVGSGLIGSGQCGAGGADYETLHQSPGLDVASYHDYGHDDSPIPGDQWNGLQRRIDQMARIAKPLIVGEVGITAADGVSGCNTTAVRRDKLKAKADAQFRAGVDAFIPWVWSKTTRTSCDYDIKPGDLTLALLRGGLPRDPVTSDLWCREVPLEGCSPCPGPIPRSSART